MAFSLSLPSSLVLSMLVANVWRYKHCCYFRCVYRCCRSGSYKFESMNYGPLDPQPHTASGIFYLDSQRSCPAIHSLIFNISLLFHLNSHNCILQAELCVCVCVHLSACCTVLYSTIILASCQLSNKSMWCGRMCDVPRDLFIELHFALARS